MYRKLLLIFLFSPMSILAREGMWIPSLLKALNEDEMQTMGMQLTAEDLYSINSGSIKDAIVHFNGGCTAEVISKDGLILTNHHCGFSAIQSHSSIKHDYLTDGFWAMSRDEELPNPGMTVTFIKRIEDVTDKIMSKSAELQGDTLAPVKMRGYIESLQEEYTNGTSYDAVIKPFNYGNAYFIIITQTYKDIRLVGAPPSSIGKYGGDTDNWMWPRHTGDFSLFRIYANGENEPADFSEENVPYKPLHSLPISLEGIDEGDFVMVYGFPGRTYQYLTSYAVDYVVNKSNPARIGMRDASLAIMKEAMRANDTIRIQYASKQARVANAWKKWKGQNIGLERFNAIQKKKALEDKYRELASTKREWQVYGELLPAFEQLYAAREKYQLARDYFIELVYYGPGIFRYTKKYIDLVDNYDQLKEEGRIEDELDKLRKGVKGHFKNYNKTLDRRIFTELMTIYSSKVEEELLPGDFTSILAKNDGVWDEYASELYEDSYFVSEARMQELLDDFSDKSIKKIQKDPGFELVKMVYDAYGQQVAGKRNEFEAKIEQLMRLYVKGLMEMMPDKRYWYDANSTLRVTYGKVEGSSPRDGMSYRYYTTMDGVLEKHDPDDPDFQLPDRLIELAEKRDYGQYAQDGELFVCFTGSNHTTGGNSGSPAINGEGHLIGLNFDRSWESTMSDIMFNPEICRNIMVDIRYVLFIVDKFAGADHLIEEMELITPEYRKEQREIYLKNRVKALTDSIKKKPEEEDFLVDRAAAYNELGMQKPRYNDLDAAFKKAPRDSAVIMAYAGSLLDRGDYGRVIHVLNTSARYLGKNPDMHFMKGLAYSEQKNYRYAISAFGEAIDLAPSRFKAYYNRGVCYHILGQSEKGCEDFRMAQELGGNKEQLIFEATCKQ